MIIDTHTIRYLTIALGGNNEISRKKNNHWTITFDDEDFLVFPKEHNNNVDDIIEHLNKLFQGRTLMQINDAIIMSDISYEFRAPIISHLSLLISNIELKNMVQNLNDKFAILTDTLELKK